MAAATDDDNANSSSSSFSVKLIIDKKEKRVLCAEAGKDFVDFLFNFLAMPVGAIARLVVVTDDHDGKEEGTTTIPGCIEKLYDSARNLDLSFFKNPNSKDYLVTNLHPETKVTKLPLLPIPQKRSFQRTLYKSYCNYNTTLTPNGRPYLYFTDTEERCRREADFVKDLVTYMVMDDLTVSPLESTMSTAISLLTKFNIKDLGVIEERVVQVGISEGLELLRAFMRTKSALTSVFLEKKEKIVKEELKLFL
ncbi:unnamed protein product [Linum tenue]|uniref:DUF674 family protein n=1 Tax=Linum tenue TaxID=586396 RepID=A0AAV0JPD5_9ROSI|nr:unnamed protein product [Linum tenue]